MKWKLKHRYRELFGKLFIGFGVGLFVLGIGVAMTMAAYCASN